MKVNVGTLDRVARAALGVVLLYLAFFSGIALFDGAAKYIAAIVGIVMLFTAATRSCMLYTILGIKTCPRS